jgi:chemotaxis protein CheD
MAEHDHNRHGPTPGGVTRRPGPERQTLVERMAQARERTVAARGGGAIAAAGNSLHLTPPPPSGWQVRAKPGESVMLMPGQMHFGGEAATVRTLLGSCVAVTLWHPVKRIGGMCHFLLPSRPRRPDEALEGKYGDEALEAMVARLRAAGTDPADYEAHLYGGADTMPEGSSLKFNVGERNIEQGWSLIDRYGFQLQGVDVGEDVPRTVTLTLASGGVEMRRGGGKAPPLPTLAASSNSSSAGLKSGSTTHSRRS